MLSGTWALWDSIFFKRDSTPDVDFDGFNILSSLCVLEGFDAGWSGSDYLEIPS